MTDPAANFRSRRGFEAVMAWYDAALRRINSDFATRKVHTRYGDTRLIEAGTDSDSPVVMLPGWGANAAIFFKQIDALARAGYRVIAVDTIGQAGRSAPVHLDTKSADYALWLGDVLDGLGVARAHLIGITGGGWLALRFAAYTPSRALSLALVSPMGLAPYKRPAIKTTVLLIAFALLPIRPLVGPYMRLHTSSEAQLVEFGGEMLRLFFRHYRVLSLPCPPLLPEATLRRITAPALVLFAADDVYFDPPAAARTAQARLSDADVKIMPQMGHLMIFDQPERVNARLRAFLAVHGK